MRLVPIGAAGTGKSTVLRMVEALADKFFGPMSMREGAPSNAVARLIGGDTAHALLTLPLFGNLYGPQGHLTDPVKRTLRRKWKMLSGIQGSINVSNMFGSCCFLSFEESWR